MKNKANHHHIKKELPGLVLMWRDDNPLDDKPVITNNQVTHINPHRRLTCLKTWQQHHNYILTNVFTWLVNVDVFYRAPNKAESNTKIDQGEFRITARFRVPNDTRLCDAIENFVTESKLANALLADDHKNKGEYLYTDFKAQIVGF